MVEQQKVKSTDDYRFKVPANKQPSSYKSSTNTYSKRKISNTQYSPPSKQSSDSSGCENVSKKLKTSSSSSSVKSVFFANNMKKRTNYSASSTRSEVSIKATP